MIHSGLPKSKSEPVDLKKKQSSKTRVKSSSANQSKSKSSHISPGGITTTNPNKIVNSASVLISGIPQIEENQPSSSKPKLNGLEKLRNDFMISLPSLDDNPSDEVFEAAVDDIIDDHDDKTYSIEDNHETDIILDESSQDLKTMTFENKHHDYSIDVLEAEELPRDSFSSRESTPKLKQRKIVKDNPSTSSLIAREKEMDKLRNDFMHISLPSLDDNLENSPTISGTGYKSEGSPRSSLARRQDDRFKTQTITKSDFDSADSSPRSLARRQNDRFKTQTITKSDLDSDSSSSILNNGQNGSRKSIRQKRLEDAERYKTQTISSPNSPQINTQQEANKPMIAPKPKSFQKTSKIPQSPKATPRLIQSRQINKIKLASPSSPKSVQKCQKSKMDKAPLASPTPSTISSISAKSSLSSSISSRLVRQGTFTKDEEQLPLSSSNNGSIDLDITGAAVKTTPRKTASNSVSKAVQNRSPRSPKVIPQTRTSALRRERSRSRQLSGSSTASSNRSINTTSKPKVVQTRSPRSPNLKTQKNSPGLNKSSSSTTSKLSLKSALTNVENPNPKSNPKIQIPNSIPLPTKTIPDTVSESSLSVKKGKKSGNKISNLWKRVEDSSKKKLDKTEAKKQVLADNKSKVWLPKSKDRDIPESDMAYLRPDEAQKKLISDFQKAKESSTNLLVSPTHSTNPTTTSSDIKNSNGNQIFTESSLISTKVKSKSRLSLRLSSKFKTSSSSNNPSKKENSFTYTSHLKKPEEHLLSPGSSGMIPMTSTSVPNTPMVEDVINGNQNFAVPQIPNGDQNQDLIQQQHQQQAKRLSHNGYFFNNTNNAEKNKTSAIVPPFNHSPIPTPPPHPSVQQRQQHEQNLQTMVQNSSALRRNDSYLGSMGRIRPDIKLAKKNRETTVGMVSEKHHVEQNDTSSSYVTLV